MRTDYIRTARAKGLTGNTVINRHALKNALIPVVAMIGIQAVFAVGGSTIMETIWRLPGLGQYIVDVVLFRDYTMLQALTMFIAMIIIVINLLVDISYAWLDPRIRYQ
jgi:peptide/nickel transport system permease protein